MIDSGSTTIQSQSIQGMLCTLVPEEVGDTCLHCIFKNSKVHCSLLNTRYILLLALFLQLILLVHGYLELVHAKALQVSFLQPWYKAEFFYEILLSSTIYYVSAHYSNHLYFSLSKQLGLYPFLLIHQ